MNILVTGGAGFIGRHLCKALKGHKVHIVDKKNSEGNFHYKNGIHQIDSDDLKNIDIVFHLAAYTDVKDSIKYPVSYFYNNVVDSINLIEECKRAEVGRFIFASSAAVYGNTRHVKGPYEPITSKEDTGFDNPIDPYGASKRAIEVYLKAYHESFGLSYAALRLFNVYGPDNNKGVIHHFFKDGIPTTINGNGKQVRDYIHVDDVVRAFILAMEKPVVNGIFNVGTGVGTNLNELATAISHEKLKYKRRTPFTIDPYNQDKITMSIAQTLKSKNVLGFEAEIPLGKGLGMIAESIYK